MVLFYKRVMIFLLFITFILSQQADSAKAIISPNEVFAGQTTKEFNYKIYFFSGTADSIIITNPFKDNSLIVSSIKIKGEHILMVLFSSLFCSWVLSVRNTFFSKTFTGSDI